MNQNFYYFQSDQLMISILSGKINIWHNLKGNNLIHQGHETFEEALKTQRFWSILSWGGLLEYHQKRLHQYFLQIIQIVPCTFYVLSKVRYWDVQKGFGKFRICTCWRVRRQVGRHDSFIAKTLPKRHFIVLECCSPQILVFSLLIS